MSNPHGVMLPAQLRALRRIVEADLDTELDDETLIAVVRAWKSPFVQTEYQAYETIEEAEQRTKDFADLVHTLGVAFQDKDTPEQT